MSLLDDPARGWVAVEAADLRPGDCLIRGNRRGPVVRSVERWEGWVFVVWFDRDCKVGPFREPTAVVVERWLEDDQNPDDLLRVVVFDGVM